MARHDFCSVLFSSPIQFSDNEVVQQGKVNFCMKIINYLMCHPNNPEYPKTSLGRKCVNCLKPARDETVTGEPKRESWENRCQFFMSTLGMSVGLGSVWRFPTLTYKMGGASFLIIYATVIMLLGNSLFFFEVTNGQYTSKGPLRVYDKVPPFQGVGFAMIAYSYLFCTYYIHMVSFAIYYFFACCFVHPLPWTYCPDETIERPDRVTCTPYSSSLKNGDQGIICGNASVVFNINKFCSDDKYKEEQMKICCSNIPDIEETDCPIYMNSTKFCGPNEYPSAYYWTHSVVKEYRPGDPEYGLLGEVNGYLVMTSLLAWIICYIGLYKGLSSLGVMMYIIVPLPYIILIIMFIVAVIQEGALEGLKRLFIPDFSSFIDIEVWRTATEQAFYSVGVAMGPLVTFGSYQKFSSPSHIDGTLICVSIVLTGILCSLVVFSVLGFMSVKTGRDFDKVVRAGPGLVFVVYPESLELLPGSGFFAALFYLMLISLGISSVTGIIETVSSAVYDIWPITRHYKYLVNLFVIFSSFLIGISITARGGLNVYNAFDTYAAGMTLIPICALELVVIVFIYGIGRFCEDISFMLGFYPNRYYRYLWLAGPFLLTSIFIYGLVKFETPKDWKLWTHLLSWSLFFLIMGNILVTFIVVLVIFGVKRDLKNLFKTPASHGPADPVKREERESYTIKKKIF